MARYRGGYKNAYAKAMMAKFFANTLERFNDEVADDGYFRPAVGAFGERKIEEAIFNEFGAKTLIDIDVGRECEKRSPRNGRSYGAKNDFCFTRDDPTDSIQQIWNMKDLRGQIRKLLLGVMSRFCAEQEASAKGDPLKARFDEIRKFFKLNELEGSILELAYVRASTDFERDPFCEHRGNGELWNRRMDFYAMAIDRSVGEVRELRNEKSKLRKYDFVDEGLDIRGGVLEFLNGSSAEALQGRFYRKAKKGEVLPWNFYGKKLQKEGALIKRLIAARKGEHGVNILLYGAPGTGKTSFANTLAQDLGLDVYEVMHGEEDGRNSSLGSRLIGVQVCNEQLPRNTGMMVVDEADEILNTGFGGGFFGLFSGGGRRESEKGQVNSMLDSIRVPTVWISNAPAQAMADSVRRRFDYSICFHELTHEMRVNIWRNNVKKLKLGRLIGEEMLDEFAAKYATNAGGISMVLKNLKDLKPGRNEVAGLVEDLMKPHCELLGVGGKDDKLAPAKDYSLEGLNLKGDVDLGRVTTAVKNYYASEGEGGVDRPRMNLLLWGPPGTGKTEFVKYLAKSVGRKVRVKMGSDLLSMWVGGAEANIKRAFAEAEASGDILFLDEIDGIVQDRSGAEHSWEVTRVNELLYQMENFKGVMVAATNFMDNLDQAIMRRFTFKFEFDYLADDGKKLFFERMFKTALTAAEAARLSAIRNLAPGDFRTVRQAMYYLGGEVTNAQRLAELEKESAVKKVTKHDAHRIGF